MKLYHYFAILAVFCAVLTTCSDNDYSSSGEASEATQELVRARVPLYYKINSIESESSEMVIAGKVRNVAQLAINVTLTENLYQRDKVSEDLLEKLEATGGFDNRFDKTFIKRVATEGETKTIYGELILKVLVSGKEEIQSFSLKDADGSAMSAFNRSEVIIVGTEQETEYVQSLISKINQKLSAEKAIREQRAAENEARIEAARIENERLAAERAAKAKAEQAERVKQQKLAKEMREKAAQAEKERIQAEKKAALENEQKAADERYQAKLNKILTVLKAGNAYEGVYKNVIAEKVQLTVVSFDPQLLFGIVKVSSKETDYSFDLNLSLKPIKVRSEREIKISGKAIDLANIEDEQTKESALYRGSQNMTLLSYEIAANGIVTLQCQSGEFVFSQ